MIERRGFMPSYAIPLSTAFIWFAVLSFLGTVPWTIYQYRKYGYFNIWRNIVLFSFIYYCLTAFFLVSLPLPKNRNDIEFKHHVYTQLKPFNFLSDFNTIPGFKPYQLNTYPKMLKSFTFLQLLFNVALLFPLGVYLRFFFKKAKKWYIALPIIFSVTLFFEVSQLTALFGYYTYPYRLFDVDDLMMNTLGGLIGFFTAPVLLFFIPSRDQLHQKDKVYSSDHLASYGSQLVEALLTLVISKLVGSIIATFLCHGNYVYPIQLLISVVFMIVLPIIGSDTTIGGKIIRLKLLLPEKKRVKSLIYRFILIYTPSLVSHVSQSIYAFYSDSVSVILLQVCVFLITSVVWIVFGIILIKDWIQKRDAVFFNYLSRVTFVRK
ncbi:VanZ family protein [Vagococcus bubulae]|nr:VanZ family protein [Vagococcus bubulae]